MAKKEIKIQSLTEYIHRITQLRPKETDSLSPEELVFRGLSSRDYQLVPSIERYPSKYLLNSLLAVENDLISQAQQKFPDIFDNTDLPTTKLAKLQHYGIPTRMMDVTSSALVALYFACQKCSSKEKSQDGEVIAFSMHPLSAYNEIANTIADTYRLSGNIITTMETFIYRAMQQNYCVGSVHPNWEQYLQEKTERIISKLSSPFLVEALETSLRQKNQQGKYIIFPNQITEKGDDCPQLMKDELVVLSKTTR